MPTFPAVKQVGAKREAILLGLTENPSCEHPDLQNSSSWVAPARGVQKKERKHTVGGRVTSTVKGISFFITLLLIKCWSVSCSTAAQGAKLIHGRSCRRGRKFVRPHPIPAKTSYAHLSILKLFLNQLVSTVASQQEGSGFDTLSRGAINCAMHRFSLHVLVLHRHSASSFPKRQIFFVDASSWKNFTHVFPSNCFVVAAMYLVLYRFICKSQTNHRALDRSPKLLLKESGALTLTYGTCDQIDKCHPRRDQNMICSRRQSSWATGVIGTGDIP